MDGAPARVRHACAVLGALIALATWSCGGGHHGGPGPTQEPPPTLTCPGNLQAQAHNGQNPTVNFDTPAASDGTAPVTVACTPASGTTFALGTTPVNCTASDAQKRTATCSFNVEVTAIPRISQVKFMAFGDSITEGTTSPAPGMLVTSKPDSYPYKLQAMLSSLYSDQTIEVINEGHSNENVNDAGKRRFRGALDVNKPDVVLLLQGANDLNLAFVKYKDPKPAIPLVISALEEMAKEAHARKIPLLLASLTPQDPEGSRGHGAPALPELNAEIRKMAREEGAIFVDLFNGLGGTPKGSIGVDGLHPTPDGYTKIAEIWFDAIRKNFEDDEGGSLRLTVRKAADAPSFGLLHP